MRYFLFALTVCACSKSADKLVAADVGEVVTTDVTATDAPAAVSPADAPSAVTP